MENLKESKCLATNCHKKENCERFTRPNEPRGDAYQNFKPLSKGVMKGECFFFVDNKKDL